MRFVFAGIFDSKICKLWFTLKESFLILHLARSRNDSYLTSSNLVDWINFVAEDRGTAEYERKLFGVKIECK